MTGTDPPLACMGREPVQQRQGGQVLGINPNNQGSKTSGKGDDKYVKLRIITFNTNGQQRESKRKAQYKFLNTKRADIVFLQETHSELGTQAIWGKQFHNMYSVYGHGESNAQGVSIHCNKTQIKGIMDPQNISGG